MVMGSLLVVLGVAETVRVLRSGDGGLVFWFGTLVGGGALILGGVALDGRAPAAARVLMVLGCFAGMLPTTWTLVIPALLATLIVLRVRQVPRQVPPKTRVEQPSPTDG